MGFNWDVEFQAHKQAQNLPFLLAGFGLSVFSSLAPAFAHIPCVPNSDYTLHVETSFL